MTADREIIFWIAIAYVIVFSTPEVIEGNNNGVCKRNVSYLQSRKIYYIATYQEMDPLWPVLFRTYNKTQRVFNITYVKQWKIEGTCCENYKDNNGTCEPQCSSPCMNGYCEQPDACACNLGYGGKFCDVPLLCVVNVNSTAGMSKPLTLQSVQNISENPHIEPMIPTCHSKCQKQFNSTTAVKTIQSADGRIQYLISIASPCNSPVAHSSYIPLIGASMGFVLFAVIFYTLYIIKRKQTNERKDDRQIHRKRRTRHMMKNEATELMYNDVGLLPINNTYDEVLPPTPNYDDVIVPPNNVYDEVFSVPSYDYVSVQPISVHGDVNVGSNCVHDEVYVEPIPGRWSRSNPRPISIKNSPI